MQIQGKRRSAFPLPVSTENFASILSVMGDYEAVLLKNEEKVRSHSGVDWLG